MKKIFGLSLVLLLAAGCTKTTTQTSKPATPPASSATSTQTNNPTEAPLVFDHAATSGAAANYYKGYLIVQGNFEIWDNSSMVPGALIFHVDQASQAKLPKKFNMSPSIFGFINEEAAKQMLKTGPACQSGQATIAIRDYVSSLIEGENWDSTTLAAVLNTSCK